ncbi:MAG: hypothetical protein ACI4O8_11085 [Aristaeellaceae bacterium]
MRRPDPRITDIEFPSRYTLDEARFPGGSEHIRNKEDIPNGPTANLP